MKGWKIRDVGIASTKFYDCKKKGGWGGANGRHSKMKIDACRPFMPHDAWSRCVWRR